MFEDLHEIATDKAYLKAVEEEDVSLEILGRLPAYENLKDLERRLKDEEALTFQRVFHEPTGFYFLKSFLMSDYSGDKALFLKDVEMYRSMRFESARRRAAKLLFNRYVSEDPAVQARFHRLKTKSIFELLEAKDHYTQAHTKRSSASATSAAMAEHKRADSDDESHTQHSDDEVVAGDEKDDASEVGTTQDVQTGQTDNLGAAPATPQSDADATPESSVFDSTNDAPKAKTRPFVRPSVQTVGLDAPRYVNTFGAKVAKTPAGAKYLITPSNMQASGDATGHRDSLQIGNTNEIGVYGKVIQTVQQRLRKQEAPTDLFDEIAEEVMNDLQLDVFPRFVKSPYYRRYICTKAIEDAPVKPGDFATLRLLGRGGFGMVYACRKKDSGAMYAMKCINKRQLKSKGALSNVMEERDVLTMLNSKFVTNLKYALQDDDTLYLIMDLLLGGDLKFHLIAQKRFDEERCRFSAAEVLLGLEHIHGLGIIYRDLKLENVLLDRKGHCRLSDLGLAVITRSPVRGYAGTPGYTAPEMVRNKKYGREVDLFSLGVLLYRMLCGSVSVRVARMEDHNPLPGVQKPFKGKGDRELDHAVVHREPRFPKDYFSPDAKSLLKGLLCKDPRRRLGAGPRGMEEVKEHPFFSTIDWGLLEAGRVAPPFVPNQYDVNAASSKDIGQFNSAKYRNVQLSDRFKRTVARFDFISKRALQEELVAVLEKLASQPKPKEPVAPTPTPKKSKCCTIL